MAATEIMLAFFFATALFAYIPGPSMLYTAAQTIAHGRAAGLTASLGLHVGGYVHVLGAAAGLSALFHQAPALYMTVKLAGAGYLILLGIFMFHRKSCKPETVQMDTSKSPRRTFFESIVVEILNPKTALFFIAFLPQFTDPNGALPIWSQLLILGAAVNVIFSSADVLCVGLASAVTNSLAQSRFARRNLERIGGVLLVCLGTHLALQEN